MVRTKTCPLFSVSGFRTWWKSGSRSRPCRTTLCWG